MKQMKMDNFYDGCCALSRQNSFFLNVELTNYLLIKILTKNLLIIEKDLLEVANDLSNDDDR